MRKYGKDLRKQIPFIRLLPPLIAGILTARYLSIPSWLIAASVICSSIFLLLVHFLSRTIKYPFRWLAGVAIHLLIFCTGTALMYYRNIEHRANWIGKQVQPGNAVSVVLQEPLVEKNRSWKALGEAQAVLQNSRWIPVKGKLLLYFTKDSMPVLQYGSQIIVRRPLQSILNSGNPGAFDYRQYCASQDIYHQVFLQPKDYLITGNLQENTVTKWLFETRDRVLSVLKKYIPGEKELGVAEALLIGYRNDLDKDLVRSYSLTGVVHIIAISGLHLGMIYGLLLFLLKPFHRKKWIRWLKPVVILFVLWGFSLLAGAAASILRSAVMFSFIVVGESLGRKTQVYNTLAASAFCMLVFDPFYLWDIGFQLSYAAVLSIILFMKPLYRQLYCSNKLLDRIWQLNAITLSAQVLTLPIILFYFHQFPNLFLFTNFIAVPLSGLILYGELLLVCLAVPAAQVWLGKTCSFLIEQMNGIIERTGRLPFAVTGDIQVNLVQVFVLYGCIISIAVWLLLKNSRYLVVGLGCATVYFLLASIDIFLQQQQHKLIVYNVPKRRAIDVVEGRRFRYIGDSLVQADQTTADYHLRPSRILHGVQAGALSRTIINGNFLFTRKHTVLLIDSSFSIPSVKQKLAVSLIVISGNPRLYLHRLAAVFDCPQYVFDNSNPLWKIRYWKKDADSLHLRHHSIPEQGAFEMAL